MDARTKEPAPVNPASPVKAETFRAHFTRYWQLYAMLLLPVVYFILFKYVPMLAMSSRSAATGRDLARMARNGSAFGILKNS